MSLASHGLSWPNTCTHETRREGVCLGLAMATAIWLWIAVVDAVAGNPFHTFATLGGIVPFTIAHYALNITLGVVLLSVAHAAERAPSVVIGTIFVWLTFEAAIAMFTNVLAETLVGRLAWVGILGGSLIGAAVALTLIARSHPLLEYLHRAEHET